MILSIADEAGESDVSFYTDFASDGKPGATMYRSWSNPYPNELVKDRRVTVVPKAWELC